jgi:hypothetical protein
MRGRVVAAEEEEVGVEAAAEETSGVERGGELESFGMKVKGHRVGYYL